MQRFCVSMGVAALFSIEAHARHVSIGAQAGYESPYESRKKIMIKAISLKQASSK